MPPPTPLPPLRLLAVLLLLFTLAASPPTATTKPHRPLLPYPLPGPAFTLPDGFAVGADLSFLRQTETAGFIFKDNGHPKPGLQLFRDHGYTWIRLRLLNNPGQLPNNLAYTLATAQAAKKLGYKFLLDFCYSDTATDPSTQSTPAAWSNKTHAELVTAVHDYTRDTLFAFQKAGGAPDIVQIGNEITSGMLWPDGQLAAQWNHFADLLKAAIAGVNDAYPTITTQSLPLSDPPSSTLKPQIMLSIDRGGDRATTKYFFDKINDYKIPFDIIGQSYYPWRSGSLDDLAANLAFMANTYKKPIIIAECAYNSRPAEYRIRPGPFAESPGGQKAFLQGVTQTVLATPNQLGQGVFYGEPAVARGSRGMFDAKGNALPAITAFDDARKPEPTQK